MNTDRLGAPCPKCDLAALETIPDEVRAWGERVQCPICKKKFERYGENIK